MARCHFCGRQFKAEQGVRAHLRHCGAYKDREPKKPSAQTTPHRAETLKGPAYRGTSAYKGRAAYRGRHLPEADKETGFDPALHVRQQVEAEEARLRLRQLNAAHDELDQKELERARRARQEAEERRRRDQEQMLARERAHLEAEEREATKAAEEERRRARRELIRRAKASVDSGFVPGTLVEVPTDVRAAIKREIEEELSAVPTLEELSQGEVDELAEGIAARHHRPLVEEDARRKEEKRQREQQELEGVLSAALERRERQENKQAVIAYGYHFASEELDELGVRPWIERYTILEKVEQELRRRFDGTVSKDEIEDEIENVVEAILHKCVK